MMPFNIGKVSIKTTLNRCGDIRKGRGGRGAVKSPFATKVFEKKMQNVLKRKNMYFGRISFYFGHFLQTFQTIQNILIFMLIFFSSTSHSSRL